MANKEEQEYQDYLDYQKYASQSPAPAPQQAAAPSDPSTSGVTAGATGLIRGASANFAPAIGAAANTAMDALTGTNGPLAGGSIDDLVDEYRHKRDSLKADFAKAAKAHPYIAGAGDLVGGGIAMGAANKALGLGSASTLADYARQGAAYGGIAGLGGSDADLTKGEFKKAADDTIEGMGTGAAAGAGGHLVGQAVTKGLPFVGKKILTTLGPSSDAIDAYIENPEAINSAVNFPGQGDQLASAVNTLGGKIRSAGGAAVDTLSETPSLPKDDLVQALKGYQSQMGVDGSLVGKAAKGASGTLGSLAQDVSNMQGDAISERGLKKIVQALDDNINWEDPSASQTNEVLTHARTFFDSILKNGNEKYEAAMQPVSDQTRLMQYLQNKFNLKKGVTSELSEGLQPTDATANNLKNVLNENKGVSQDSLDQLKDLTGHDAMAGAQNFNNAQQFQGSYINGARRTVTGAATGAALGHLTHIPGAEVVGGAIGAQLGAVADREGGKWVKGALDASQKIAASTPEWFSNLVKNSPQSLGRWAPILVPASKRGGNSLGAADYVLQQSDPDYRKHLQTLQSSGDQEQSK